MQIKQFVFNPVDVNCFLLWDDTKEALLIDAGVFSPNEKDTLKEFISKNSLKLVKHLNTHLHFDHIFGNPFVEEQWGVKAMANDADWQWVTDLRERVTRFGLKYNEEIPSLGKVLKDGDKIEFGHQVLEVIHVPGHSPGSLAYYNAANGILFSGDALFQNSIGRTDFPDADYNTLQQSIKEKLFVLPGETVVFPGHGESTTIGHEKKYNSYI